MKTHIQSAFTTVSLTVLTALAFGFVEYNLFVMTMP